MAQANDGTTHHEPLRIGVLGAGMIASTRVGVLPNLPAIADKVTVVAIADTVAERAKEVAKEFAIPETYASLDAMLEQSDIDAVVNLTPIAFHGETSLKILRAGKHLATEKPLGSTMEDADAIIETAAASGLTVVCAPPDALFPTYQEARRLLDQDAIGKVAFARVRSSHAGPGGGPFGWPTDPSWFYQLGSGPLLDMGVYGIHEITALLGPAERVVAFSGITEPTRVVRGGPFEGTVMDVTADDNTLFMLDFGGATFAVVDGTFNVHAAKSPKIEIFGRRGALNIKDGGGGDSPIELYRADAAPGLDGWVDPRGWRHLQAGQRRLDTLHRAVVVDHLVDCVRTGARPVLSAEHARHALEIMLKVVESSRTGQALDLATTF
ncbi:Gfo/Idh/MocA family protein [Actinopolymorpha pittospori]|uniref:Dehydrogenase n=1 Tax=Actinopolymorpha pittospori TaxID=648752 RepID=A0A927MYY7_9ACTN|nr:Gfo/Idh/MocA family oxidoreductase [Actinopolymorpha pittospori]MBE1609531.1 putative dehydrogenase [Actinopolymorpha pittospori]